MKKGQIVYSQGVWKCRVVEDQHKQDMLRYIAIEGGTDSSKGKTLSAWRGLFQEKHK